MLQLFSRKISAKKIILNYWIEQKRVEKIGDKSL